VKANPAPLLTNCFGVRSRFYGTHVKSAPSSALWYKCRGEEKEVEEMLREERPWPGVYGGRLSDEPTTGSLAGYLEDAVERYRDNVALTQGERKFSYGGLLDLTERLGLGRRFK
jgi:hypothetical protein